MARFVLLALFVCCLGSERTVAAPGPSFSCTTARDTLALIICSDPSLSELDLEMVRSFYALRHIPSVDQQRLRAEADDHYKRVIGACNLPTRTNITPDLVARAKSCITNLYRRQRDAWAQEALRQRTETSYELSTTIPDHLGLQELLIQRSFLDSNALVDGVYGPSTRAGIQSAQAAAGLPQTGFPTADLVRWLRSDPRSPQTEFRAAPNAPRSSTAFPPKADPLQKLDPSAPRLSQSTPQGETCPDLEAYDVALVVDNSISMGFPATLSAADEQKLGPSQIQERHRLLTQTPPELQRMAEARRATLGILDTLPSKTRIQFFTFGPPQNLPPEVANCLVTRVGNYDGEQRADFRHALDKLQPEIAGTPLAFSIDHAAAAIRRRVKGSPGFVIVVTDGLETCNADPCAAAQRARALDPDLSIIVVDIAENKHVACLAEVTEGRVFSAGRGSDIGRLLSAAIKPRPTSVCYQRTRPIVLP